MRTAAIMCAIVAAASAASGQGLGYGVKAGINLAELKTEDDGAAGGLDTRVGLVAGGFISWPLGGRLALQPEVLFSQKGATFEQDGASGSLSLDYLEVPLLATFRVVGAPGRHLSLFGGPAVGLRLRARSRATFGDDTLDQDVSDDVASSDVAVVGGAAYHLGRLAIEGRYSWGLTDIDKLTEDDPKVRSRAISFLAGWKF